MIRVVYCRKSTPNCMLHLVGGVHLSLSDSERLELRLDNFRRLVVELHCSYPCAQALRGS